jgi:hypothetical protein
MDLQGEAEDARIVLQALEREHFGELAQFDGRHHDWFEGRGSKCCLITFIDDATKIRLSQFFEEETIFGAMTVLKLWIERTPRF